VVVVTVKRETQGVVPSVTPYNSQMEGSLWSTRASFLVPLTGLILLVLTWGSEPSIPLAIFLVVAHISLVMMAVAHAEAIAHRVGEPYGTLVLALAVTVIEVSLIVTLMATEGDKASTLARDTVFAAVMIVCNGFVGLAIFVDARKDHIVEFSEQGANALLGTVMTITTLSLVMPNFTSSSEGATFSGSQLIFSAVSALAVYLVFVFVQTVRHRWMFLSPEALEREAGNEFAHVDSHTPRSGRAEGLLIRSVFLLITLAGVIGLAKTLAPSIEDSVVWAGAPPSFVGVVIALLVLLPEGITALRAASRGEMQTSLNLSLGSGLASIGLTIPAVAVATIWLDGPVTLGLGAKEIVLLALTAVVSTLTFGSGKATILQGAQHLAVFAAFLFLAVVP
jgi:Ca2+:H+ antiporter